MTYLSKPDFVQLAANTGLNYSYLPGFSAELHFWREAE